MSSRKTFGLVLIVWTAVSAASGRDMWRATPEGIERTPAWMVFHAQRPVDTNEVVVADVPRDMKLFLLVGQSNMAGRGRVSAEDAKPILAETARRIPNAALVKASDLTGHLPDGVHFDTPSYRTLGVRYYEAWKRLSDCDAGTLK